MFVIDMPLKISIKCESSGVFLVKIIIGSIMSSTMTTINNVKNKTILKTTGSLLILIFMGK